MGKKPKGRLDGEGSIYRSGNGWIAQISLKGRLIRRRAASEEQAVAKLTELRDRRNRQMVLTQKMPRFQEWAETWLSGNRRLKASTRESYRLILKQHAFPTLGRYLLSEISSALLQEWINELDESGLASNTIRNIHGRVRTCLQRGVRDRVIDYNPALGLDLPTGRERQPIALDEHQARTFLTALTGYRNYTLYVLALTLGMRQGELLALTWSDVSWKAKTLTIRRTLRRAGNVTLEGPTKTKAGSRVLDLSDDLLTRLRTHWQNQEEEQIIALRKGMPSWNAGRRVFCNEAGREIAARNLLRHFEKVKQAAGLPDALVFHDLRHTAGSLMLARGHDILDVSKILGHANPGITLKIYAHSYTEKRRQATADLAAALLKEAQ